VCKGTWIQKYGWKPWTCQHKYPCRHGVAPSRRAEPKQTVARCERRSVRYVTADGICLTWAVRRTHADSVGTDNIKSDERVEMWRTMVLRVLEGTLSTPTSAPPNPTSGWKEAYEAHDGVAGLVHAIPDERTTLCAALLVCSFVRFGPSHNRRIGHFERGSTALICGSCVFGDPTK
jgi:hypothetical protein